MEDSIHKYLPEIIVGYGVLIPLIIVAGCLVNKENKATSKADKIAIFSLTSWVGYFIGNNIFHTSEDTELFVLGTIIFSLLSAALLSIKESLLSTKSNNKLAYTIRALLRNDLIFRCLLVFLLSVSISVYQQNKSNPKLKIEITSKGEPPIELDHIKYCILKEEGQDDRYLPFRARVNAEDNTVYILLNAKEIDIEKTKNKSIEILCNSAGSASRLGVTPLRSVKIQYASFLNIKQYSSTCNVRSN